MNDLDDRLRRGLEAATRPIEPLEPVELSARLRAHDARSGPATPATPGESPGPAARSGRRLLAVAAALVVIAGAVGIGVGVSRDGAGPDRVAADGTEPDRVDGFDGWAPGWHELDTGPVPMGPPSIAWFDGQLYAAASVPPVDTVADGGVDEGTGPSRSGLWAFDPMTEEWSTLAAPPFEQVEIVATSDGLVAVGGPAVWNVAALDRRMSWATWSPDDDVWELQGAVPVAEQLRAAASTGPTPPAGGRSLLWTGEVVLDLTFGAVLDPAIGTAAPLEMPDNLLRYTHLLQSTPVWTGTRAVMVSWSTAPGLAWDRAGTLLGEVPGPTMADSAYNSPAAAVALSGDVVLMASDQLTGEARVARLDPSDRWESLAPVPATTEMLCPYRNAPVSGSVVVQGCEWSGGVSEPTPLYRLEGSRWSTVPSPPRGERGIERWLGTEQALVVWSGDADTTNNPDAPYQWLAVWIPDGTTDRTASVPPASTPPDSTPPGSVAPTTTTTIPVAPTAVTNPDPSCTVDQLPDIRRALPESLDVDPAAGIGGMPFSEELCARHWTDPDDPAHHVTQQPGGIPFAISGGTWAGGLRWGEIHDGFGAEYVGEISRSSATWGLMAFGFDEDEFAALVDRIAGQLDDGS